MLDMGENRDRHNCSSVGDFETSVKGISRRGFLGGFAQPAEVKLYFVEVSPQIH